MCVCVEEMNTALEEMGNCKSKDSLMSVNQASSWLSKKTQEETKCNFAKTEVGKVFLLSENCLHNAVRGGGGGEHLFDQTLLYVNS